MLLARARLIRSLGRFTRYENSHASFLLSLICWFAQPLVAAEPLDVSLVRLIANPKDYDGKVVRVIGFMRLEFEVDGIYLHQDDYKHSIYKNGLWIDAGEDMHKRKAELDQKYVLVEGTFNANRWSLSSHVKRYGSPQRSVHGHVSLWRDSNLRSTAIAHFNELQLFDLPPLRCALGVLRCEFG